MAEEARDPVVHSISESAGADVTWVSVPPYGGPRKCPVCQGRGLVAMGFYSGWYPIPDIIEGTASSIPAMEPCRSCAGVGIVWAG